jgi:lipid-A-disaccharide synthase-like uncharacterized protein
MLYTLSQDVGNFLHEIFVDKFDFWLIFGLGAQVVFTARFLVQWLASEREGRSVMPVAFWWLSICGGMMTLVYGVMRRDAVIIVGQAMSVFIYLRNLTLIYREKNAKK